VRDQTDFVKAFNAGVGKVRLVLLVSPTCTVCLSGVARVEMALAGLTPRELKVHVVWVGVLADDSHTAASERAAGFSIEAEHYWDGDLVLSARFHEVLSLASWDRKVAWDLYLLYDATATFGRKPPPPAMWMHQLQIEDVPELDATLLVAEIRRLGTDGRSTATVPVADGSRSGMRG